MEILHFPPAAPPPLHSCNCTGTRQHDFKFVSNLLYLRATSIPISDTPVFPQPFCSLLFVLCVPLIITHRLNMCCSVSPGGAAG